MKPRFLRKLRMNIDDAMDQTGLPLLGMVPEDEGGSGRRPGRQHHHRGPEGAALAYYNIAKRITGQRVPLMRF